MCYSQDIAVKLCYFIKRQKHRFRKMISESFNCYGVYGHIIDFAKNVILIKKLKTF